MGLGYDGDDYLSDFYMYNNSSGYWVAKKSFPGTPRERAAAFSIDGKAYVGVGYNRDLDTEELSDFWMYDPDANEWTQVNDFGGSARYNAISFAIGSVGYVGTGYDGDNYNSDFWSYTPATDTWTEIVSYPGDKLEEGTAFIINNTAYLCTGRNNGLTLSAFWSFNPESGGWTDLKPDDEEAYYDEFTDAVRRYDAFVILP
ncbi:MAG: hypothetical protein HC859_01600 [Bacteroidia bacterium]|nr:hypothetical protein [Bacteroidia bacterium]